MANVDEKIPLWQPSAWPFAKRCLARARLFSSHSTLGRPSPSPWTPGARKPWQPRRRPAHLPSGGMRSAGRSSWRGNTNLLNNRRRVRLSRRNPDREQLSSVTNVTIISNRSPGWKFTSENRTRLSKLRRSFVEILKKRLWTSHSKVKSPGRKSGRRRGSQCTVVMSVRTCSSREKIWTLTWKKSTNILALSTGSTLQYLVQAAWFLDRCDVLSWHLSLDSFIFCTVWLPQKSLLIRKS